MTREHAPDETGPGEDATIFYRVGVDVGGTFTDICVLDDRTGAVTHAKVPSSDDPVEAIVAGLRKAGIDARQMRLFAHGTTITTNALISRQFQRSAMVCTAGFRDVIEIRRGTKPDLWDAYADVSPPYIARRDRFGVTERTDYRGEILTVLDEDEARGCAQTLRKRGVTAVAVCFINSYANAANEQRMREILDAEAPGIDVSLSSEVLPEIFEHERFSTTVINTVVGPLVGRYIARLEDVLSQIGYQGDIVLIHSGGGMLSAASAARFGARLASSGIAAGAVAGQHVATTAGYENAICLDMGGTSTDLTLVADGELKITREWSVEYGYPVCFPSIEILTIGAGGGSIAWIDSGGALRSGPQSAGANPGPAAYGRGGEAPTTTDANLVLGRLGDSLVDGEIELDRAQAERAIEAAIGGPLGLGVEEAAAAMVEVANAKMADALRLVSVRKGYDPREFVLVAFGGAGGLHAARLAHELAIPRVIVPPSPGLLSAMGCLLVDVRHDLSAMFFRAADDASVSELEAAFLALEAEAQARLEKEGVALDDMQLTRTIDMRYAGQWRSIAVVVDAPLSKMQPVLERFQAEYEREHAYRNPASAIEIYRINVRAVGVTPKPRTGEERVGMPPSMQSAGTSRPVLFDLEEGWVETSVYRRGELTTGTTLTGPAIIEDLDSTILVPTGVVTRIDPYRNVVLELATGDAT
jgi:N-methylhydantoinase A